MLAQVCLKYITETECSLNYARGKIYTEMRMPCFHRLITGHMKLCIIPHNTHII